jgi:hypothetical protein
MNEQKQNMTIHFITGKSLTVSFTKKLESGHPLDAGRVIETALKQNRLVIELEEKLLLIPFSSIEHIELSSKPLVIPKQAIRNAEIVK